MNEYRAILLQRYSENLSNSANRNHLLSYARHFLDNAHGLDRHSIDEYLQALRKDKKYRPGTINYVFRVIRRLYAVNNFLWEYKMGEAPQIKQRDEYRPQLSPEFIGAMIGEARTGKLLADEQCFLALSTTYGLRRGEMADLQPQDMNLETALFVATQKMGRERYHLIAPEIKPYLAAHDFTARYGTSTLTVMFKRIVAKSGLGHVKAARVGWHAIRRALWQGMIDNGINPMAARMFMRWKGATGEMAMPARYYGNVVIGVDARSPVLDEAKGDEDIFAKHPFLPYWRDDA